MIFSEKAQRIKPFYIFVYIKPEEDEVRWMLQLKSIRFRQSNKVEPDKILPAAEIISPLALTIPSRIYHTSRFGIYLTL